MTMNRAMDPKRGRSSLRREPRGQTQVEFVLSILFVLLLIFGIIEMILFIHTYNVLADAAKEGVRYAIVHGCDLDSTSCSGTCVFPPPSPASCSDASADNVKAWARGYAKASFHDTSAMTVAVNYPDGSSSATNRVQVTISYPYQPIFGFGWPSVTVRAAAEGRIAY